MNNPLLDFAQEHLKNLFIEYGLKRLTNFKLIFNSFNQKKANFLEEWINTNFYLEKSNPDYFDLIQRDKILVGNKKAAFSNYSKLYDLTYKVNLMKAFKGHWVYFKPHISINGRLAYSGFAPTPHTGDIFRFVKTKYEKVTKRGLFHLKCAISCVLKNRFSKHNFK